MELKRVVVTGLGAVTPVGNTPEEMWKNLLNGVSGAAPIASFDTTLFKTKFACEVKNLDVNEYLDRKEARKMDRYTQLALIAAKQAVEDSKMDLETEDGLDGEGTDRLVVRQRYGRTVADLRQCRKHRGRHAVSGKGSC